MRKIFIGFENMLRATDNNIRKLADRRNKLELPTAATWHEWKVINSDRKERMPIQYFWRDTVPTKIGRCLKRMTDLSYRIRLKLYREDCKNIIVTDLKDGYYEADTLIIAALEKIFKDYIEGSSYYNDGIWIEGIDAIKERAIEDAKYQKIIDIHTWFTVDRIHLLKKIDDYYDEMRKFTKDNGIDVMDYTGNPECKNLPKYKIYLEYKKKFPHTYEWNIEKQIKKNDKKYCKMMIDNMDILWN